jgi:hypothetical protein
MAHDLTPKMELADDKTAKGTEDGTLTHLNEKEES